MSASYDRRWIVTAVCVAFTVCVVFIGMYVTIVLFSEVDQRGVIVECESGKTITFDDYNASEMANILHAAGCEVSS